MAGQELCFHTRLFGLIKSVMKAGWRVSIMRSSPCLFQTDSLHWSSTERQPECTFIWDVWGIFQTSVGTNLNADCQLSYMAFFSLSDPLLMCSKYKHRWTWQNEICYIFCHFYYYLSYCKQKINIRILFVVCSQYDSVIQPWRQYYFYPTGEQCLQLPQLNQFPYFPNGLW